MTPQAMARMAVTGGGQRLTVPGDGARYEPLYATASRESGTQRPTDAACVQPVFPVKKPIASTTFPDPVV